jgi:glycyl-tRNA synthetase beta chain
MPAEQTAKVDEFRGPKAEIAFAPDGALTKAGQGFARSRGAAPEDVRRETMGDTEFAVVRVEATRDATIEVLPTLVARLITGLQIPRGMRWGRRPAGAEDYLRFSRPIRWLVCKFDKTTVTGSFYGMPVGDGSYGHRVLGGPTEIDTAEHYEQRLAAQCVIVSQHERRRLIVEGLDAAALDLGGVWSDPGDVLSEAVYLTEWPTVARGRFGERHLRLPDPVLVTAMQSHQRYFPMRDAEGRLLSAFLYVGNADPQAATVVTRGNERVLEGRLDDAEFAYDRDIAEGLDGMAERLKDVVFHERLGSLADKSERLEQLVTALAAGIGMSASDAAAARAAAALAKADLVSQVVIEFPVLQGTMGELYAAAAGKDTEVAQAIGEHYRPVSAVAPLPSTRVGALLAIADKIDNILGAWVADAKPSGSRDPYGLRRAAMGTVRNALVYDLRFPLEEILEAGVGQFEAQGVLVPPERRRTIVGETAAFIRERLEVLLLEEGTQFPSVEAALAAPVADLPAVAGRARAFSALTGRDFFEDAVIAYNRCAALAAKDAAASSRTVDPGLFKDAAEGELHAAYESARGPLLDALAELDVERAFHHAAGLRPPVDRYFDAVLVMDDDAAVRANRLAQLAAVAALVGQIGEFSRLPAVQV